MQTTRASIVRYAIARMLVSILCLRCREWEWYDVEVIDDRGVSILCLRCGPGPATEQGPARGSFNSLFEMQIHERYQGPRLVHHSVSILCLRCTGRLQSAATAQLSSVSILCLRCAHCNSSSYALTSCIVSILCLRCPTV